MVNEKSTSRAQPKDQNHSLLYNTRRDRLLLERA